MKKLKLKVNHFQQKGVIAALFLSAFSLPGLAVGGYTVQEIPLPAELTAPAGQVLVPSCLSMNENGQVACHAELIDARLPSPADRFSINPKVFASYAYRWDSATNKSTLLSDNLPGQFDHAFGINAFGDVVGAIDTLASKKPQGTKWFFAGGKTLLGNGVATDIDDQNNYVLQGQLVSGGTAVKFAGKLVRVDAINPNNTVKTILATGTQQIGSVSGTGLLYTSALPSSILFALTTISKDIFVRDITDNGHFVISGTPQTIGGLLALNCSGVANCQLYFPSVTTLKRAIPFITLTGVDSKGNAVGTDGGFALLVKPPTSTTPTQRIDLNSLLSVPPNIWFLNEATDLNESGKIIGMGKAGVERRRVAFMLTPN